MAPLSTQYCTKGIANGRSGPANSRLTFQAGTRQITCDDAQIGTFVATFGATAPSPCPAGTYQDLAGQAACKDSPVGAFVATAGAPAATLCRPRQSRPDRMQGRPVGTFVAAAGAASVELCDAGTF